MDPAVWAEIDELRNLKTADLRAKYQEAFGVETRSSNKQFLFRRLAWRLQARTEGDLSERARRRAAEIVDEGDVRLRAPRDFVAGSLSDSPPAALRRQLRRDWRLPRAGTILTRQYHGQSVVVHVKDDGFQYQERHYRSLSAIAREVTGTRWNGLAFFHLTEQRHG
jgi:hypothetical protein